MTFANPYCQKKIIVTRIICFSWLLAKIISWKVWLASRLFPVIPPFDFLFAPQAVHLFLFVLSLSCIAALLIFPTNTVLQIGVIIIELLSCSLDQNRWQAWEYQYIFIVLALLINRRNERNALNTIAFIFISIYFFSGLGKMNAAFSGFLQRELIFLEIVKAKNSYSYNLLLYHLGYLLGLLEIFLGIGLAFMRTNKPAAILLICMHLGILALLGPFGINYNVIIWPWNIAIILYLYLLFIRRDPPTLSFHSLKNGWNKIFILFFGLLPFLNFFGYWDYFLSSSLYSYKPPEMYICIHDTEKNKALMPFAISKKSIFICDSNATVINVRTWSMKEMNVPAYPEIRVYKKIKQQLLSRYPGMNATFIISEYTDGIKRKTELK
ncbi:MAG: hypothetical protein ABI594_19625 [Ginsengibacter sp.]